MKLRSPFFQFTRAWHTNTQTHSSYLPVKCRNILGNLDTFSKFTNRSKRIAQRPFI